MKYYSQVKQDEFLHRRIFGNFQKGIFLDLGAFDGVSFSNTYFFEKNLSWKGSCFEPIPMYYKLLKKNRKCKCYNNCIGDKEETVKFLFVPENPMLSGISKNINIKDLDRIGKIGKKPETIRSRVIDIHSFLKKNKINEIHLLSLDIEGNEKKVLEAIDFEKTFVHTICLEDNYNEKKMEAFLKNKGFVLIKHCGFDKIFINKKSSFFPRKSLALRLQAKIINSVYTPKIQQEFRERLKRFPKIKNKIKEMMGV